jgi:hypothetical protein
VPAPFVGREAELAALSADLDAAASHQDRQPVRNGYCACLIVIMIVCGTWTLHLVSDDLLRSGLIRAALVQ